MRRELLKSSQKLVRLLPLLILELMFSARTFPQEFPRPLSGRLQSQPANEAIEKPAPDAQVKWIADRIAAAGLAYPSTVENVRHAFQFYAQFAGPPETVFHVEDRKIAGPGGEIPIRIYSSQAAPPLPVWIFFHGGGFVGGSLDTHDAPLRAVANRCGCLIVSVGYRLAPENPFPAAPEDAYAATKWAAAHAPEIDGDAGRIAVGGDGAGGNLAAVVALMARDRGGPHLVAQILLYPLLDATMTTYSWAVAKDPVLTRDAMVTRLSLYVPFTADQRNAYISPANAASFKDLPPTFVIAGEQDPSHDTIEKYVLDLKSAGVAVTISRYANSMHSFFLMAGALDAAKMSIDETASDLRQAFKGIQ